MKTALIGMLCGFIVANHIAASFLPATIRFDDGPEIPLLKKPNAKQKPIDFLYASYTYQVLDAKIAYYKIMLPNKKEGWVAVPNNKKKSKNQQTQPFDKETIVFNKPRPVMNFPGDNEVQIGVAIDGYTFDILDVIFSYIKVTLPNQKQGWIYAGPEGKKRFVKPVKVDQAIDPLTPSKTTANEVTSQTSESVNKADAETSLSTDESSKEPSPLTEIKKDHSEVNPAQSVSDSVEPVTDSTNEDLKSSSNTQNSTSLNATKTASADSDSLSTQPASIPQP